MPGFDPAFLGQHCCVLDTVFQFPNIAWPQIIEEQAHRLGTESINCFSLICCKALKKVASKQRDIVASVPESRHMDGDYVETVVEVLSKMPFFHFLNQNSVGGGKDAYVHGQRLLASQTLKLLCLQDTKQLDLGGKGDLPYLIQKNSATVGLLEAPGFLPNSSGEGSLFMAKELAFEKSAGYAEQSITTKGLSFLGLCW